MKKPQYNIEKIALRVIQRVSSKYKTEKLKPGYTGKYVIQKHKATNTHYDLRLQFPQEGKSVLRSWSLPKHRIPRKVGDKVLATETEDHPMSWGNVVDFGETHEIPEGQYGAGEVTLYDKGKFALIDVDYDSKYVIQFKGEKLDGIWALIKTEGKDFLFVKSSADQPELDEPEVQKAIENL